MVTAARQTKPRSKRTRAARADVPRTKEQESAAAEAPGAVLEAAFAALPEASPANGALPEIVRKNRRERARRRLSDALTARGPYAIPEVLRAELGRLVERWAHKGFEDAFEEADAFEIRCAEERAVLDAAARGDEEERFAAAERAYRRAVESTYGQIEIRGLQLSARVRQDLEIAYVPLHVEDLSERTPPPGLTKAIANKTAKKTVKKTAKKGAGAKFKGGASAIDAQIAMMLHALERPRVLATHALTKHPRLLLVGEPGSGKSTLIAYLATRAARGEAGLEAALIPFVVPVRSLPPAAVTLDVLARAAFAEPWFLEEALRRGRALLLIDGLDEARPEVAGKLLSALTAMLEAHAGSRVLVTTRPAGAPDEDVVSAEGFAQVRLVPMSREEVSTFIGQWCLAAELSLNKHREQAEVDARAAAEDLRERVKASRAIEKLAQTPLLASVICVVHRFLGQRIPERRVALYEAITNVLLYEWDRAKFPEGATLGQLDAHAKRALLARLALSMHEARLVDLPAEEVVKRFAAHLPDLGRAAEDAESIVAEIRDRNGVLVERSPGSFGFSHLTFQEYLAAMELVNAGDYDKLLDRYEDEWWHEVIVLAAGFPGLHAERLIRGLLEKDGEKVAAGTMLAAQCVETAIEVRQSLRREIENHVAKLIPPISKEEFETLERLGDLAGPVLFHRFEKLDAEGKAPLILLLGCIRYEPAMNMISTYLRDPTTVSGQLSIFGREHYSKPTLASCAAVAMFEMLGTAESGFASFLDAIPMAHLSAIIMLRNLIKIQPRTKRAELLRALVARYEAVHPQPSSSAAPSPRRAARSG